MPSATPSPRPYITPMPLAGFSLKSCYRAALTRARFAHSWEDRLDALATAERLRHRILAEQGRYRLSVADYSNKMVRARAHGAQVRRVFAAPVPAPVAQPAALACAA